MDRRLTFGFKSMIICVHDHIFVVLMLSFVAQTPKKTQERGILIQNRRSTSDVMSVIRLDRKSNIGLVGSREAEPSLLFHLLRLERTWIFGERLGGRTEQRRGLVCRATRKQYKKPAISALIQPYSHSSVATHLIALALLVSSRVYHVHFVCLPTHYSSLCRGRPERYFYRENRIPRRTTMLPLWLAGHSLIFVPILQPDNIIPKT
ncbi:hypothetical protein B0H12DRAFT_197722 [Mycena haematopus]|nr:hypothetical protein B0H12DRAFT_197722 [Mycena haematopus]